MIVKPREIRIFSRRKYLAELYADQIIPVVANKWRKIRVIINEFSVGIVSIPMIADANKNANESDIKTKHSILRL